MRCRCCAEDFRGICGVLFHIVGQEGGCAGIDAGDPNGKLKIRERYVL